VIPSSKVDVAAKKKKAAADQPTVIWPEHFPPNGCPPKASRPANDTVYRLSNSGEDWKSALELNRFKKVPDAYRAGLSSYTDIEELRQIQNIHEKWANHDVVGADLRPNNGRIEQTGRPSHHTIWLTREALAERATLFEVVT
jgi:hypothetical protein